MPDPLLFCDEEELTALYGWIDECDDLSREKRNITKDFADGVMVAELIAAFLPRIVELHNYQPAASRKGKLANWNTVNKKVLKKLRINIPENVIEAIVSGVVGVVEVVLIHIKTAIFKITKPPGWQEKKTEEEGHAEARVVVRQNTQDSIDSYPDVGAKKKKKKTGRAVGSKPLLGGSQRGQDGALIQPGAKGGVVLPAIESGGVSKSASVRDRDKRKKRGVIITE